MSLILSVLWQQFHIRLDLVMVVVGLWWGHGWAHTHRQNIIFREVGVEGTHPVPISSTPTVVRTTAIFAIEFRVVGVRVGGGGVAMGGGGRGSAPPLLVPSPQGASATGSS